MAAPFRSKVLDIGSYANARVIRDHTKRKVFAENEPLRYAPNGSVPTPSCQSATAHLLSIRSLCNGVTLAHMPVATF